jgi:hypothetical protein
MWRQVSERIGIARETQFAKAKGLARALFVDLSWKWVEVT